MHPNSTRVLTASRMGDTVLLSYQLGLAVGLTLLSRRDSEPEFSPLAEDEPSPVADDRPKLDTNRPEARFYRALHRYENACQLSEEFCFTMP